MNPEEALLYARRKYPQYRWSIEQHKLSMMKLLIARTRLLVHYFHVSASPIYGDHRRVSKADLRNIVEHMQDSISMSSKHMPVW